MRQVGSTKTPSPQRPWDWPSLRKNALVTLPAPPAQPWPTPDEAPALRDLLSDPDPEVRCLAIGALLSLREPDDAPRVAARLKDEAEGVPALAQTAPSSGGVELDPVAADGSSRLNPRYAWFARTVGAYARLSLRYFTGENLDARSFPAWWARNQGGRQAVWYWEGRLHGELQEALAVSQFPPELKGNGENWEELRDRRMSYWQAQRQRTLTAVGEELHHLPAEVEAKIRLVALNQQSSGLGADLYEPLMGDYDCQRLLRQPSLCGR